jgi:multisubunit Na+/H+ antiporter MnhB subunit
MKGMSLIVRTITRLLVGFILVYGAHIVLYGHLTPGGGFAGGVMLACALILLVLAFGKEAALDIVSENAASAWDCIGALLFLLIALLGLTGGYFFRNVLDKGKPFDLLSAGTLMWSNIAIGIKVGACLFLVFLVLAVFRIRDEG